MEGRVGESWPKGGSIGSMWGSMGFYVSELYTAPRPDETYPLEKVSFIVDY